MQFSEGTAVRHLEAAKNKITKLEAHLLRTEQLVDEKERSIYHHRVESRNKIRHLRHTIQVGVDSDISSSCIKTTQIGGCVFYFCKSPEAKQNTVLVIGWQFCIYWALLMITLAGLQ